MLLSMVNYSSVSGEEVEEGMEVVRGKGVQSWMESEAYRIIDQVLLGVF